MKRVRASWRLVRRVSPLEAEVLMELLRRTGRGPPHFLETTVGRAVRFELIYDRPPPQLPGWKREKLRTADVAANNALKTSLRIGRAWLVAPPGLSARETGRNVLIVDPGLAFGSGRHETTHLCLELLESVRPGPACLDLGTGSGILAIAAAKLGFRRVTGVDSDPRAIRSAQQNERLNAFRRIQWIRADLERWSARMRNDLVVANLLGGLLIKQAARIARWVRPGGSLILSGTLRAEGRAVAAAYRRQGFALRRRLRRGRWVAMRMAKMAGRRRRRSPRRAPRAS